MVGVWVSAYKALRKSIRRSGTLCAAASAKVAESGKHTRYATRIFINSTATPPLSSLLAEGAWQEK